MQVKLPKPSAVASFTATPGSITSQDNPARWAPIQVATSSSLSLSIAFDDGAVRDFSRDVRVVYASTVGSTLCEIVQGEWPANAG